MNDEFVNSAFNSAGSNAEFYMMMKSVSGKKPRPSTPPERDLEAELVQERLSKGKKVAIDFLDTYSEKFKEWGLLFDRDNFELNSKRDFPEPDPALEKLQYWGKGKKEKPKNFAENYLGRLATLFIQELKEYDSILYPCCSNGADTAVLAGITGKKVLGVDTDSDRIESAKTYSKEIETHFDTLNVKFENRRYQEVDFENHSALATSMVGYPNGGQIVKLASEAGMKKAVITPCCYQACYENMIKREAESKQVGDLFEKSEISNLRYAGRDGANILAVLYAVDLASLAQEQGFKVSTVGSYGLWKEGAGKGGALILERQSV